jgi:hypothetical protein
MRKTVILYLTILFLAISLPGLGIAGKFPPGTNIIDHDSIGKQILYNGRVWRNLYSRIMGDQFLFTKEFLPGAVTIEGKLFSDLKLKYDIYSDELLSFTDHGIILQLNKEKVENFSLDFENKVYQFRRIDPDSVNSLSGYMNVLYSGNTSLFVKYRKEILLLAVDNKYDLFSQTNKIFLKKNGKIYLVNSKMDFLRLLNDHKKQVKSFIKTNKLKITKKDPWSFSPVVEYYDKLQH